MVQTEGTWPQSIAKAADRFAATLRAKLNADLIGPSYSDIARSLNDAGVMTVTGRKFLSANGQELSEAADFDDSYLIDRAQRR